MPRDRTLAAIAGALYLIAFASSIPALALKAPLLAEGADVLTAGSDGALAGSATLELVNAIACVGTALAVLPIVRRTHPIHGAGFLAARVVEAAVIFAGVASLGALVDVRSTAAVATGADAAALEAAGRALVAVNEWAFLVGPGLIPALNAALLGSALFASRLVPRWIPALGLVGAPLLVASAIATIFGVHEQTSASAALLALPIAAWELSLGVRLLARGTQQSG